MKSTKIQSGEYRIDNNGREFWLARVSAINDEKPYDNTWQLCEVVKGNNEYWNHFVTKSDAMQAIKDNS